jgi:hypothetical protein
MRASCFIDSQIMAILKQTGGGYRLPNCAESMAYLKPLSIGGGVNTAAWMWRCNAPRQRARGCDLLLRAALSRLSFARS